PFALRASATTETYTLSLHDALPICAGRFDVTGQASAPVSMTFVVPVNLTFGANNLPIASWVGSWNGVNDPAGSGFTPSAGEVHRSEEHTSELQSRFDLVCRLLLEKK